MRCLYEVVDLIDFFADLGTELSGTCSVYGFASADDTDGEPFESGTICNVVDLTHFTTADEASQALLAADADGTLTELTGTYTSTRDNEFDLSNYEQISRFGELALSQTSEGYYEIEVFGDTFVSEGLHDSIDYGILFVIGSSAIDGSLYQAVIELSSADNFDVETGELDIRLPSGAQYYALKLLRLKA